MTDGPAFHSNLVPAATGPCRSTRYTPGIQRGQELKSARVSHTASALASITISLDSQTGALWSASMPPS